VKPIRREPPSTLHGYETTLNYSRGGSRAGRKTLLYEFSDIIDPRRLPRRMKYLQYYILGLVDGEGCFSVSLKRQGDARFGWVIDPVFHVAQSKENRVILEILKRVFKCGRIIPKPGQEDKVYQYVVDSRRHLAEVIIPFFEKNKPIIKAREFEYFKEIVYGLERKEHKELDGFISLLKKAYEMSGERKHSLEDVLMQVRERVGASETIRRAPPGGGEDMVQHH
jgi:hypothetical protein